jgi:hypothetical protein
MLFRQLFDPQTKEAVLVDPVLEQVERDLHNLFIIVNKT